MAEPELVVIDPLLLLLELDAEGNKTPPSPLELPEAEPPAPVLLFDDEVPVVEEQATGIPNAKATTAK